MKVAILGCGPAGLLAAHACRERGVAPTIMSRKAPSKPMGAQYLHVPIKGLTENLPEGKLTYQYVGSKQGYAIKVYKDPEAPCSWRKFPEVARYWPMHAVYIELWKRNYDDIIDVDIDYKIAYKIDTGGFDLVINSVPRQVLVEHPDKFEWRYEDVWIRPGTFAPPDTIIYNGLTDDAWYRTSNIFNQQYTEFAREPRSVDSHYKVRKPLSTDCHAYPHWLHVGRYGKWSKEELAHDAYEDTKHALHQLLD